MIKPTVTTGLEALGRGHDLSKLDLLLSKIAPLGPEVIAQHLNVADYITRVAASLSIDTAGLILSPEEQAERAQAMQMQAMMEKLGPKGMDIIRDQLKPEAQNGQPAPEAAPQ